MKATVTGVSAWQGTPTSGTLDIEILDRYIDASGNATVSHYSGTLDPGNKKWVDAQTGANLWVIVQGPDDPPGPSARFYEVLVYADRHDVRTKYERKLISSDLAGTMFDYAEPTPVNPAGFGDAPLTMRAAQALVDLSPQLTQDAALALAAAGTSGRVSTSAQLPAGAPVDTQYLVEATRTIWKKTASGWVDSGYGVNALRSGLRSDRLTLTFPVITQYFETDTHITMTYFPGTGWRGPGGENIDNPPAPPPPDTGVY